MGGANYCLRLHTVYLQMKVREVVAKLIIRLIRLKVNTGAAKNFIGKLHRAAMGSTCKYRVA
jgi:hypothetical protein